MRLSIHEVIEGAIITNYDVEETHPIPRIGETIYYQIEDDGPKERGKIIDIGYNLLDNEVILSIMHDVHYSGRRDIDKLI